MGALVHLKSSLFQMETFQQVHQYVTFLSAFLLFYAWIFQHHLPALHNEGDIDALLNEEASDYQQGYQAQIAHLVADRKRQIRLEIGCTTGV